MTYRESTERTIERRVRYLRRLGSQSAEFLLAFPRGRWRKRHPFDCGRPRCGVCHGGRKGRPVPRWKDNDE